MLAAEYDTVTFLLHAATGNMMSMVGSIALLSALSVLIKSTLASVDYPPLPEDLTTPYQQRLAIYGPNGEFPRYFLHSY